MYVLQTGNKEFIREHTDPFYYSQRSQPQEMFYGNPYSPDAVNVPDDRFVEDIGGAYEFATKDEANEKKQGLESDYSIIWNVIPV